MIPLRFSRIPRIPPRSLKPHAKPPAFVVRTNAHHPDVMRLVEEPIRENGMHDTKSEFVHGTGLKYDDLFNPSSYFSEGYFDCDKLDDVESLSSGRYWTHEKRPHDDPGVLARAILRIIRHGASNRTIGKAMADASVPEIADLQLAIYDFLSRVQAAGTAENDEERPDPVILTAGIDVCSDRRDVSIIAWSQHSVPRVVHGFSVPGTPGDEHADRILDEALSRMWFVGGEPCNVAAEAYEIGGHHTEVTLEFIKSRREREPGRKSWAIRWRNAARNSAVDAGPVWPSTVHFTPRGSLYYRLDKRKLENLAAQFDISAPESAKLGSLDPNYLALAAWYGLEATKIKDVDPVDKAAAVDVEGRDDAMSEAEVDRRKAIAKVHKTLDPAAFKAAMEKRFDSPNPFTDSAFRVKKADARASIIDPFFGGYRDRPTFGGLK